MRVSVLILSGLYDFSTDLICIELERTGITYVRLNREQLAEYKINFDPVMRVLQLRYGEKKWIIQPDLQAVVFRQPVFLRNTPAKPLSLSEQMERSQWLRAISVFKDAKWINWPQSTYLAESKPYQLFIAKSVGFHVPATVVTNDVTGLPSFASSSIILKSLDTALFFKDHDCYFTYTTVTTGCDLAKLDATSAPMIVQEEIRSKTDIRVTVIGNEVFAVEVLSNGTGIDGDWRTVQRESLEYVSIDLPSSVEFACRELMSQLDLTFGAIDLIRANDVFYFVEINPTGEWAWLQSELRDLAGAFVRAIYS